MFAELARRDLERLRVAGKTPTDAQVVRLNDLAVQLERGKDTTAVNHPRVAFAGNAVLHEPTVGMLEWWWQFGHDAAMTLKGKLRTYYFALAHARTLEILSTLQTNVDIRRAVKAWSRGVAATDEELFRAMLYVRHGEDAVLDAEQAEPDEDRNLDSISQLIALASGQVGVSPDALKTETESSLMAMIRYAARGGSDLKPSVARLYMAYQATIREIEGGASDGK